MKKVLITLLIFTFLIIPICSCSKAPPGTGSKIIETWTWLAHGPEAPDDIVAKMFELNYRANMQQDGTNPPASMQSDGVELKSGSKTIYLVYRKRITSKNGEFRNNLIIVQRAYSSDHFDGSIKLDVTEPPSEIKFTEGKGSGHLMTSYAVLAIEIPETVKPGIYEYTIGIEFNSMDFGTLPGTIEVVE